MKKIYSLVTIIIFLIASIQAQEFSLIKDLYDGDAIRKAKGFINVHNNDYCGVIAKSSNHPLGTLTLTDGTAEGTKVFLNSDDFGYSDQIYYGASTFFSKTAGSSSTRFLVGYQLENQTTDKILNIKDFDLIGVLNWNDSLAIIIVENLNDENLYYSTDGTKTGSVYHGKTSIPDIFTVSSNEDYMVFVDNSTSFDKEEAVILERETLEFKSVKDFIVEQGHFSDEVTEAYLIEDYLMFRSTSSFGSADFIFKIGEDIDVINLPSRINNVVQSGNYIVIQGQTSTVYYNTLTKERGLLTSDAYYEAPLLATGKGIYYKWTDDDYDSYLSFLASDGSVTNSNFTVNSNTKFIEYQDYIYFNRKIDGEFQLCKTLEGFTDTVEVLLTSSSDIGSDVFATANNRVVVSYQDPMFGYELYSGTIPIDQDNDGFFYDDDCDDNDSDINPGVAETPYDGIDNDCNPMTFDDDLDQDGFLLVDDCNDENADINPDAEEIPNNGIDEDCDGEDLMISSSNDVSNASIKIYPTLTKDLVYFNYGSSVDFNVRIINAFGSIVFTGLSPKIVDLSIQNSGIYFIEFTSNSKESREVRRIIKY